MPRRIHNASLRPEVGSPDGMAKSFRLPSTPLAMESWDFSRIDTVGISTNNTNSSFIRNIGGFSLSALERLVDYGYFDENQNTISLEFIGSDPILSEELPLFAVRFIRSVNGLAVLSCALNTDDARVPKAIGNRGDSVKRKEVLPKLNSNNGRNRLNTLLGIWPDSNVIARDLGKCLARENLTLSAPIIKRD